MNLFTIKLGSNFIMMISFAINVDKFDYNAIIYLHSRNRGIRYRRKKKEREIWVQETSSDD